MELFPPEKYPVFGCVTACLTTDVVCIRFVLQGFTCGNSPSVAVLGHGGNFKTWALIGGN
jgi:hypothetical protein